MTTIVFQKWTQFEFIKLHEIENGLMASGYPGRVRLQFSSSTAGASAGLSLSPAMHLMYTLDENGNRIYTLKVRCYSFCRDINGKPISPPRCRKSQTRERSPSLPTQVRTFRWYRVLCYMLTSLQPAFLLTTNSPATG